MAGEEVTDRRIITHAEVPDESLAERIRQPITSEQLDQFTEAWADTEREYVPAEGWLPQDFPQLTTAFIPYTSTPIAHPDPYMTITNIGWMFIEVGNIRFAIPDREEWDKLINMGERMWNSFEADAGPPMDEAPTTFVEPTPTFVEDTPPPPSGVTTEEGEDDDADPAH